jgi:hypothetical protein
MAKVLLEVPTDADLIRGIAALGDDSELAPAADFLRAELLRRRDLRGRIDAYLAGAGPRPPEWAAISEPGAAAAPAASSRDGIADGLIRVRLLLELQQLAAADTPEPEFRVWFAALPADEQEIARAILAEYQTIQTGYPQAAGAAPEAPEDGTDAG